MAKSPGMNEPSTANLRGRTLKPADNIGRNAATIPKKVDVPKVGTLKSGNIGKASGKSTTPKMRGK